jgi:pyruvate dehydrogenase E1 component
VDRNYVAVAALKALADENKVPSTKVADAITRYGIDPDKPNPATA